MVRVTGALIGLAACSDYGYSVPRQVTDEWLVQGNVDIVVVGDTSDSMADTLSNLTDNMVRFVSRLEEADADWHLMAVTGDDGCAQGGVLDARTPQWEELFTTGITTKPGEDLVDEWGLYNGAAALTQSEAGGCNEGFLRDEAYLHLVFISDEDDNSPGFDGSDPDYWRTYVDAYQAAKDFDSTKLQLSAVGGPAPIGCSFADFARGYWEAVQATEGDFLSICDDWVYQLDALADSSVVQDTFKLRANPYADTVRVFVDGLERIDGWSYRARDGTVVFVADPPFVGQSVTVHYTMGTGEGRQDD
jgi:hypothetical protein